MSFKGEQHCEQTHFFHVKLTPLTWAPVLQLLVSGPVFTHSHFPPRSYTSAMFCKRGFHHPLFIKPVSIPRTWRSHLGLECFIFSFTITHLQTLLLKLKVHQVPCFYNRACLSVMKCQTSEIHTHTHKAFLLKEGWGWKDSFHSFLMSYYSSRTDQKTFCWKRNKQCKDHPNYKDNKNLKESWTIRKQNKTEQLS